MAIRWKTVGLSEDSATGPCGAAALTATAASSGHLLDMRIARRGPDLLNHTLKWEDPWFRERKEKVKVCEVSTEVTGGLRLAGEKGKGGGKASLGNTKVNLFGDGRRLSAGRTWNCGFVQHTKHWEGLRIKTSVKADAVRKPF